MEQLLSFVPLGIAVGGAAVGYGMLRQRVVELDKRVDTKASQELVEAQYSEIIHRLDRIERNQNGKH